MIKEVNVVVGEFFDGKEGEGGPELFPEGKVLCSGHDGIYEVFHTARAIVYPCSIASTEWFVQIEIRFIVFYTVMVIEVNALVFVEVLQELVCCVRGGRRNLYL